MRTEPTFAQRLAVGVVGLVVATALGLWLALSYFSVWTSDTKVSVDVPQLGDAIGPGAKVRYHGIIVGRVLSMAEHGDGYRVSIVVEAEHATSIPSTATGRILPSTVFGSEYVELLAPRDASGGDHLASGDVLQADTSSATLRLMDSFDEAERLVSAIDAEDLNRVTGALAPALAGHGDDIKEFLERADRVVTDVNDDLPTTWETLRLVPPALDTLTDLEPDLTSALDHAGTTATTLAERDEQLGKVLASSGDVIDSADTLFERNREVIVPFVTRLERLTGLAADHTTEVRQILVRFARTGNNGAAGVDDNAIQMIGTIGLGVPHAYTPADCARYGPTLVASNCGDPVPAPEAEAAGIDGVADRIAQMLKEPDADARDDAPTSDRATPAPAAPAAPNGLAELLGGLLGGPR